MSGLHSDRMLVFSVDQVSKLVKTLLEDTFPRIAVEGEVIGFKRATSGHCYFTLTDRDGRGGTLRLDAVAYRGSQAARGPDVVEGTKVRAHGRVSSYGGTSRYQLIVESIEASGEGDLLRKLEELKARLLAEGLFDAGRKRPLPFLPRRIGIVTSLRGAAVRDMVRTILSRYPARILVHDAVVQGDGAVRDIVAGIRALNRVPDVDVIIIGRGGGSMEDLWAFNEEPLVREVAASRAPIVSAVGHEVDWVLTDHAADVRAPTPTAAGQLVVPSWDELVVELDDQAERLAYGLSMQIDKAEARVDDLADRLNRAGSRVLSAPNHSLQVLEARLNAHQPSRRITDEERHLMSLSARLRQAGRRLLEPAHNTLQGLEIRMKSLDPKAPLERGYSLTRTPDGRLVRSSNQVDKGDHVEVLLGQGSLSCVVE